VNVLIGAALWANPNQTEDEVADNSQPAEERILDGGACLESAGFYIKGAESLDWGMKNRLARIFSPKSRKTLMMAIDHGYFEGPIAGLEQVDLSVAPLLSHVDALMLTRGMLRTSVPPQFRQNVVLRASAGPSILKELSNEHLAVDIQEAIRLNAAALAVGAFIGSEFETQTVHNLTRLVDLASPYGIPVLAVTATDEETPHDARYFRMACRICAELGAQFVKTYYVTQGFETVTTSCPIPVVIAGGKKVSELEALTMAHRALGDGAAGVDMGRNIFQAEAPLAFVQALRAVVHEGQSPAETYSLYCSLRESAARR
jgi:putative autoinducer-2 (AI-2) aldolase